MEVSTQLWSNGQDFIASHVTCIIQSIARLASATWIGWQSFFGVIGCPIGISSASILDGAVVGAFGTRDSHQLYS